MILCRLIAPKWLLAEQPNLKRSIDGEFTDEQLIDYNSTGYNIYYPPNRPKVYLGGTIDGKDIDQFDWVFADMDLKDKHYKAKDDFIETLYTSKLPPTKTVDSGNGIHAYWKVSDLDAMSYLRFQRRLSSYFNTDPAVGQIFQLLRVPGYFNTKTEDFKLCQIIEDNGPEYTAEQLNNLLPTISINDETNCQQHYNKTYGVDEKPIISEELPPKFGKLVHENTEFKELFTGKSDDRSKNDFRLGHIMLGHGFTREEAMSVLYNSAKAMQRAPAHRYSYAENIVDKIYTYEPTEEKKNTSPTVREILSKGEETIKGTRFPCHKLIDDTEHGFRLGQVIGIIGGSGVGKTTLTLNMFLWFSANNPNYHHFFFSLEQPSGEVAARIRTICGNDDTLFDRIHIISNFNPDGTYVNFSLKTIEEHILEFEKSTGFKVGATVVDHIGVLAKETKNGENDGLIGVCRDMKSVAARCNIMLLMLSQAPREKAGVGDLELDKNAAYGTVFFESYVDYCICLWQPLKRLYSQGAPTLMAIKFGKIRHKRQGVDRIQEDVRYQFFFDPSTERLREVTQHEESGLNFWMNQAINARKADKKTDLVPYVSRRLEEVENVIPDVEDNRERARH